MKFYVEKPGYTMSELKATDKYILPFLEEAAHCAVTRKWIDDFREYIVKVHDEFCASHKRCTRLSIGRVCEREKWTKGPKTLDEIYIVIGHLYIRFTPIPAEYTEFNPEQLRLPWM